MLLLPGKFNVCTRNINNGYVDEDELIYQLPEDYKVEERPRNKHVTTAFGSYTAKIEVQDGKLIYSRKVQLNPGTYPREMYAEVADFYQTMYESDNEHFILSKK